MSLYPTVTHDPQLLSSAVAESQANGLHESGIGYEPTLSEKSIGTSKMAWLIRYQRLLLDRLLFAMQLHCEATETALTVAVLPGFYRKSDGTAVEFAGDDALLLDDDTSDQKIWIDHSGNALDFDTSWPADLSTFTAVAEVDTADGAIVEVRDMRTLNSLRTHAAASDLGQTNQTVFTIDADNAGAAAACGLRVNRGSSNAEDAEIRWIEASGWRFLAQHTAGTRAAIDALKLQIAGSDVINSSGDLVAAAIDAAALYTFGANGATAAGLALTAAGSTGAPSSGAHSAGELHLDSACVLWICTAGGSPGTWVRVADQLASPAAGVVTATALSDAVADTLPYVTITSSTGSGATHAITLQLKDKQGNNLAEVGYVQLGLYDDADGGTASVAHSISGTPAAGSLVNWLTSGKVGRYKTNSSGTLTLDVSMASTATTYVIAGPTHRGRAVDCALYGTVVRS